MKRKINSFSFLGVAVRHHKALAKLKQQNQKKIHCTKSLLKWDYFTNNIPHLFRKIPWQLPKHNGYPYNARL